MWFNPKPNFTLQCVSTNEQMIQSNAVPPMKWENLVPMRPKYKCLNFFARNDLHPWLYRIDCPVISISGRSSFRICWSKKNLTLSTSACQFFLLQIYFVFNILISICLFWLRKRSTLICLQSKVSSSMRTGEIEFDAAPPGVLGVDGGVDGGEIFWIFETISIILSWSKVW